MKYLLFSLALLLFSCSSVKTGPSAKGGQSALRARTLQGIDRALTPMITANDMREAFRLTIAYADSLNRRPPVKASSEWWNMDIAKMELSDTLRPVLIFVALVVAAILTWFLVAVLQQRIRRP